MAEWTPNFAGGIGRCRDHAAFVTLSAHYHWFAFQRWIVEFFDGDEKGVHIDVKNGTGKGGLLGSSHAERILSAAAHCRERSMYLLRDWHSEENCPETEGTGMTPKMELT